MLVLPTSWFPKLRVDGARLAIGAMPVPLSEAVCVVPLTPPLLSVTVSVPLRVPDAAGVKVRLITQLPLAGTELPQLFVSAKSPITAMLVMVSATAPVLLSVTLWAALVVSTG